MGCCGWRAADREPTPTTTTSANDQPLAERRAQAEQYLSAATGGQACVTSGTSQGPDR